MDIDESYVSQKKMDDKLLTVGQLAKICNVSSKTLRYYDSINLIHPVLISEENGYRYYIKQQAATIFLVKQLQEIGISLTDIRGYLSESNSENIIKSLEFILEKQEQEISIQILNLQANQNKIKLLRTFCDSLKEQITLKSNKYIRKCISQPRKIICKQYCGKYNENIFRDFYKNIIEEFKQQKVNLESIEAIPIAIVYAYDLENVQLEIGFELKRDMQVDGFITETIQDGEYISCMYEGAYPDFKQGCFKQFDEDIAVMGLKRIGFYILKFYINEALTPKSEKYMTEMQVLIKEK